ncbi:hypothetical protein BG011_004327 [Mortierella polycephala]|uniref:polynucleotide adenylyltransferase n=1 Tax=Mortierella polycephala TaxID=41804 RepID=A0A9P6Q182_9FUNG|nr:hypothetical protein BG011_004327 [Mortierella polycephala]
MEKEQPMGQGQQANDQSERPNQGQQQQQGLGPRHSPVLPDLPHHANHLPTGAHEQNPGHNSPQRSHSPFPPPFMHPNLMHLMQQTHMQQMMHFQQQQHLFQQQQQQQQQQQRQQQHESFLSHNQAPLLESKGDSSLEAGSGKQQQPQSDDTEETLKSAQKPGFVYEDAPTTEIGGHVGSSGLQPEDRSHSPLNRHSIDSPELRQGVFHPMAQHPPPPMFSLPGHAGPPGFEGEYGAPPMIPMHTPNGVVFVPMNRVTPPPGFGHFAMHGSEIQGPQFQPTFHQQQQMFMHQQMLRQQQQQQQHQHQPQMHPIQVNSQQVSSQDDEKTQGTGHDSEQGAASVPPQDQQQQQQQHQIKDIESQINQLLFNGESAAARSQGGDSSSQVATSDLPLVGQGLTVQEIEEAQVKDLQSQMRRFSLGDPVSPPRSRSNADQKDSGVPNVDSEPSSSTTAHPLSNIIHSRFQDPKLHEESPRYEQTVKAPFSAKDIDFYSDKKYDPYRPSARTFDLITRDARVLCHDLMPKPEEETRKLALLQRLSNIANEVFGEAEVLPFGSSGNGLALANADMDVCVFLNTKPGFEEVSPVEFVERIGDRLEKDPEFENILQLTRARVPIVKLNHVNGIACDIGYQNDLAIWNTRLLRAYCRIDERVRDIVVIVKMWAKRRKINNPYMGSLSSYAYVLLVIHVLQRRGVLPNLQSIVVGNGNIPFWDCQGFNRYFFEDIPNLARYWQPTPEALGQTVGELLYEFFRYYASEFRYANQVVSIRSGGLLTKEAKEWSKEHTQTHQQQSFQQQQQQQSEKTAQTQTPPPSDGKPVVKNRYLYCIEDPFELDHNVGRPVDRYSTNHIWLWFTFDAV